jgi:hypothetical protein
MTNLEQKIELISQFPSAPVSLRKEASIEAYITLKNNSEHTLTLNFSSSKTFDIFLFDEDNEVACQWSADKMFMQALQSVTIESGKSQRFGGLLELLDLEREPLTPGSYRIQIEVTGMATLNGKEVTKPLTAESRLQLLS